MSSALESSACTRNGRKTPSVARGTQKMGTTAGDTVTLCGLCGARRPDFVPLVGTARGCWVTSEVSGHSPGLTHTGLHPLE